MLKVNKYINLNILNNIICLKIININKIKLCKFNFLLKFELLEQITIHLKSIYITNKINNLKKNNLIKN